MSEMSVIPGRVAKGYEGKGTYFSTEILRSRRAGLPSPGLSPRFAGHDNSEER
jgi:hypothetical protein